MPHASKVYSALNEYQPPLTPVSEADSDNTEAASSSNATGSSTTSRDSAQSLSYFSKRPPLNFSRPRPVDFSPGNRVLHDQDPLSSPSRIHCLNGYGQSTLDLPGEPSFDLQFDPDTASSTQAMPDSFSWDEQLKDMRPLRRQQLDEAQRSQPRPLYRPSTSATSAAELHRTAGGTEVHVRLPTRPETTLQVRQPLVRAYTAPAKVIPPQPIISELEEDEWEGEDARSHHTVSEMDEDDMLARKDDWRSSIFDTSAMSSGEIRKLRKKGINPSLYVEMKSVRRGKGKWINPLVGNSYLS